jgi:GH25 family lysozyme M1 (1,4-beta-N-acetylmuramidase)
MVFFSLLFLCLSVPSLATLGVDVNDIISTSQFSCMKSNGYVFAIPRGYRSNGVVDSDVVTNIKNAWAGGMTEVDVYLFPCVPCGNPAGQATALVNAIKGQKYGVVWIDIEVYAWSSSLTANQNFITTMANQLKSLGQTVGIYSSYYNWQSIVGLGWTGCSQYPLWYAHYDNNPSFSDFNPFGGWKTPAIKQYNGGTTLCGVSGVDLNYY